ncbi:unnamed protein product [Closterium sp. Naga37s-1]|nr:unnamed protein product [Closterium sp. Naga37s-1]
MSASCASVAHASQVPSARATRTVSLGSFAGLKRVSPAAPSPLHALRAKHHAPAAAAPRKSIRASTGAAAGGGGGAGAVTARKVLMMGGTRFIGVYLARMLVKAGHEVRAPPAGRKREGGGRGGEARGRGRESVGREEREGMGRLNVAVGELMVRMEEDEIGGESRRKGENRCKPRALIRAASFPSRAPRAPRGLLYHPAHRGPQVTLFTRGKSPVTQQLPGESDADYSEYCARVRHLAGDRRDLDALRAALQGADFDAVYDINGARRGGGERGWGRGRVGREAFEVEPILAALPNLKQYIFCSSAGVYLKSDELPHREEDAVDAKSRHKGKLERRAVEDVVDPKSRHKGKLESEAVLAGSGVAWTSIRPVYIYGPLNYNPVEEWFFHRLHAGRPIPVPGSGMQITQLGHVKLMQVGDAGWFWCSAAHVMWSRARPSFPAPTLHSLPALDLARAFHLALGCEAAYGQVLNVSGARYVTFDRIATACAEAMGAPKPLLVHYNPKDFDFGKSKAFPLRNQHFFTAIEKAEQVLGWQPEYGLVEGLRDSYHLDFSRGVHRAAPNFTTDDMILEKLGVSVTATA